jgi:hypothetical protein
MAGDWGQVEAVYVDEVLVEEAGTVYHACSEVVREEATDWVLQLGTIIRIILPNPSSTSSTLLFKADISRLSPAEPQSLLPYVRYFRRPLYLQYRVQ